jgi:hypothetical protein
MIDIRRVRHDSFAEAPTAGPGFLGLHWTQLPGRVGKLGVLTQCDYGTYESFTIAGMARPGAIAPSLMILSDNFCEA